MGRPGGAGVWQEDAVKEILMLKAGLLWWLGVPLSLIIVLLFTGVL